MSWLILKFEVFGMINILLNKIINEISQYLDIVNFPRRNFEKSFNFEERKGFFK